MNSSYCAWLPLTLAVSMPVSFLLTYWMSVSDDHVVPILPLISDTGTLPPDSCVFGQLLNINAVLCAVIMYLRYRQVLTLCSDHLDYLVVVKMNKAALFVGILVPLGMSIVANFQASNMMVVHVIGGAMAFFVGIAYCVLHSMISNRIAGIPVQMPGNTPCIRKFRSALCFVYAIAFATFLVFYPWSRYLGPGPGVSPLRWTKKDPGYPQHIVAGVAEWFTALITAMFIGTFFSEFKYFRVMPPKIIYIRQQHGLICNK